MKKVTKATIAAAAAGVLLLGGAGTVALWSANEGINAGTVSTGHLTLDAAAAGEWSDVSIPGTPTAFAPLTDDIVPGDTVAYEQTVIVSADGKNLKGELTASGLTGGSALPDGVTVDVVVDGSAEGLTQVGNAISFDAAGDYVVPVTVTVTFDQAATGSMDTAVDLGSMTLVLNQIRS